MTDIRQCLLQLAGVSKGEYEAILMQGSGTIGRIFPSDVRALLAAIRETMAEMSIG